MPEIKILSNETWQFRKEAGKTQQECAAEFGICKETLSLIERRSANPKLSTLRKVADARGISVSQLLSTESGHVYVEEPSTQFEKTPELIVLAQRIKACRKHNWGKDTKMSQEDFAGNVGVSERTISLIECKKTDPRLSTIQKIAAYMGITVSELLDLKEGT